MVLDFDGTLADSAQWFAKTLVSSAEKFGYRRPAGDEIEALRNLSTRAIMKELEIPLRKLPSIARHFRLEASETLAGLRLFPGAREFLLALKTAGVTTAILSSNDELNVRRVLGADATLIDHFACGASLFGKKTKLRRLLRLCAVAPSSAIMVGDETRDIESAKAERVSTAGVTWGYATSEALASVGPDHLFRSFDELRDEILR